MCSSDLPAGATSNAWSTNGTGLGVNAGTGFTGNLINAGVNNNGIFNVDYLGNVNANGNFRTAGGYVYANNGAQINMATDNINLFDHSGSGTFTGRLNFGGTTNAYPGLARSGTTLAVKLADGSADAPITAASGRFSGPVRIPSYTVATLPSGATGDLAIVTDATLTAITGLGLAPTGGGANIVPVYNAGGTWLMF